VHTAISAAFDGGNIELVDASDPSRVRLRIRPDVGGEHLQWFSFRATGVRGRAVTYVIENAGQASYPSAWPGYRACASTDRQTWTRAATRYVDGRLEIEHTAAADAVWFAYFAPYPHERHQDLLARMQGHGRLERLGLTLDGADLDALILGSGPAPVWVVARQHPGETMAEWAVEGLLERLVDPADPVGRWCLAHATWHVVPNANPDGSRRGHLRTNAAGANLNREWAAPSAERSPEVLAIRDAMDRAGVRLCLDVHGDEEIPHTFAEGAEAIPSWSPRQAADLARFKAALLAASPDFQAVHGYPKAAPGQANLTMCTNQVGERYGACSLTLEMPFKDHEDLPDPVHGWSPARAKRLGAALLDAARAVLAAPE
jgi:murein tripeptide amidase MpaA